ncbi:hypothetical protein Tsubulata_016004, partial [Turnera subulata]
LCKDVADIKELLKQVADRLASFSIAEAQPSPDVAPFKTESTHPADLPLDSSLSDPHTPTSVEFPCLQNHKHLVGGDSFPTTLIQQCSPHDFESFVNPLALPQQTISTTGLIIQPIEIVTGVQHWCYNCGECTYHLMDIPMAKWLHCTATHTPNSSLMLVSSIVDEALFPLVIILLWAEYWSPFFSQVIGKLIPWEGLYVLGFPIAPGHVKGYARSAYLEAHMLLHHELLSSLTWKWQQAQNHMTSFVYKTSTEVIFQIDKCVYVELHSVHLQCHNELSNQFFDPFLKLQLISVLGKLSTGDRHFGQQRAAPPQLITLNLVDKVHFQLNIRRKKRKNAGLSHETAPPDTGQHPPPLPSPDSSPRSSKKSRANGDEELPQADEEIIDVEGVNTHPTSDEAVATLADFPTLGKSSPKPRAVTKNKNKPSSSKGSKGKALDLPTKSPAQPSGPSNVVIQAPQPVSSKSSNPSVSSSIGASQVNYVFHSAITLPPSSHSIMVSSGASHPGSASPPQPTSSAPLPSLIGADDGTVPPKPPDLNLLAKHHDALVAPRSSIAFNLKKPVVRGSGVGKALSIKGGSIGPNLSFESVPNPGCISGQ